jgi:hypothetical protein
MMTFDAAPEALLAVHAKRIASETVAFAFSVSADGDDQTAIGRLEKLCGRSHQPPYTVDQPAKRIDSKRAKKYASEKRSFLRQTTVI